MRAKGHRTYSGQVPPPSVLLQAQEQQRSRSELAQATVYIRAVLHIEELSTGQGRLEQCVPQSKMERTSSNPTLPTMALGRCRSKPKQSSAGGLDMHAGLCSRSTQCGTVWPGLVHGRGGACSSPGQSRLLSVGSLSGYLYMTGHEEPPAQLSRGVMPLFPVEEELAGSWPGLSWPDSPAVVTRASSSSQLQLRLQKILAWITTASRAPAGTHHPWREGGSPGQTRQPAVLLGCTQEAPANLEIVEMDLAAIPSPAS
ncbi:hypothetical protein LA080_013168 [Diaporthe eres]|nr:hypothetical protein LA080_013168 [Diaporthe eres]